MSNQPNQPSLPIQWVNFTCWGLYFLASVTYLPATPPSRDDLGDMEELEIYSLYHQDESVGWMLESEDLTEQLREAIVSDLKATEDRRSRINKDF